MGPSLRHLLRTLVQEFRTKALITRHYISIVSVNAVYSSERSDLLCRHNVLTTLFICRSFNNSWRSKETAAGGNMPTGISSFEAELCQIALVVFQQLVMAQANSGLAQLVSQWVKGLDISEHDFTCSKKACSKFVEKLDQSIEKLRRTHNQLVTTS